MTAHEEIETLWKFIRGCLCNDVTKLQTAAMVWLKSKVFLLHGMCKVLWDSLATPAPLEWSRLPLGVEWAPSCHQHVLHYEGQVNPTLLRHSSDIPHSDATDFSSYLAV